jgi:hypothetical protein
VKKEPKRERPLAGNGSHFGSKIDVNAIQKNIEKSIATKTPKYHPKASEIEKKSMPKLITNKCKNWYRTICGKSSTIILF